MIEKLSPLLLLCLPIVLSACGDSGGSDPSTNPSGVTMTGSVRISGGEAASGDFFRIEFTDRPSCVDFAMNGSAPTEPGQEGTFKIPGPVVGMPLEPSGDLYGSTLRILPETYAGPGTYVNDGAVDEVVGQITLDEFPGGPTYFLDQGTAMAIIMEDGSGELTFENVSNDTGTSTISGSVTWTCSDE